MSDEANNPANAKLEIPTDFQPMNSPTLRLEVPKKDGYHRHWFRGTPERISRALKAGYQFVDERETQLNNFDLGGDAKKSGNSDMGTRVSVISGDDVDSQGQPSRLYLMECPNHLYELGKKVLEDRNESVAAALRGGSIGKGENGEVAVDSSKRYTKGAPSELFTPKSRRT